MEAEETFETGIIKTINWYLDNKTGGKKLSIKIMISID